VRRAVVTLLALVAAGLPTGTAAAAKPLITVCGQGGCVTTGRSNAVDNLFAELMAQGLAGRRAAPEPAPQPYFILTAADGTQAWYTPGAKLLKTGSGWIETDSFARAALKTATESLQPLPAPKPTSARVNGRAAATPEVYAGLLADLPAADAPASDAPTADVELRFGTPSPWPSASLRYAPTENTVKRADGWFAVPDALAAQVESDLRREGVQGRRTWRSSIVFALVFTGALFVGWLTFYRRKWWKTGGRKRKVREPEGEAPRSPPRR
jgi:AcrR family transcriptional regulator